MRLGNKLKRFRFDHDDMSQEELARAVGVTRQTIHSIERAKFVPSTLLALKIARFFGRPLEDIFFIEPEGKE
jgi:putative transcriptional regulator